MRLRLRVLLSFCSTVSTFGRTRAEDENEWEIPLPAWLCPIIRRVNPTVGNDAPELVVAENLALECRNDSTGNSSVVVHKRNILSGGVTYSASLIDTALFLRSNVSKWMNVTLDNQSHYEISMQNITVGIKAKSHAITSSSWTNLALYPLKQVIEFTYQQARRVTALVSPKNVELWMQPIAPISEIRHTYLSAEIDDSGCSGLDDEECKDSWDCEWDNVKGGCGLPKTECSRNTDQEICNGPSCEWLISGERCKELGHGLGSSGVPKFFNSTTSTINNLTTGWRNANHSIKFHPNMSTKRYGCLPRSSTSDSTAFLGCPPTPSSSSSSGANTDVSATDLIDALNFVVKNVLGSGKKVDVFDTLLGGAKALGITTDDVDYANGTLSLNVLRLLQHLSGALSDASLNPNIMQLLHLTPNNTFVEELTPMQWLEETGFAGSIRLKIQGIDTFMKGIATKRKGDSRAIDSSDALRFSVNIGHAGRSIALEFGLQHNLNATAGLFYGDKEGDTGLHCAVFLMSSLDLKVRNVTLSSSGQHKIIEGFLDAVNTVVKEENTQKFFSKILSNSVEDFLLPRSNGTGFIDSLFNEKLNNLLRSFYGEKMDEKKELTRLAVKLSPHWISRLRRFEQNLDVVLGLVTLTKMTFESTDVQITESENKMKISLVRPRITLDGRLQNNTFQLNVTFSHAITMIGGVVSDGNTLGLRLDSLDTHNTTLPVSFSLEGRETHFIVPQKHVAAIPRLVKNFVIPFPDVTPSGSLSSIPKEPITQGGESSEFASTIVGLLEADFVPVANLEEFITESLKKVTGVELSKLSFEKQVKSSGNVVELNITSSTFNVDNATIPSLGMILKIQLDDNASNAHCALATSNVTLQLTAPHTTATPSPEQALLISVLTRWNLTEIILEAINDAKKSLCIEPAGVPLQSVTSASLLTRAAMSLITDDMLQKAIDVGLNYCKEPISLGFANLTCRITNADKLSFSKNTTKDTMLSISANPSQPIRVTLDLTWDASNESIRMKNITQVGLQVNVALDPTLPHDHLLYGCWGPYLHLDIRPSVTFAENGQENTLLMEFLRGKMNERVRQWLIQDPVDGCPKPVTPPAVPKNQDWIAKTYMRWKQLPVLKHVHAIIHNVFGHADNVNKVNPSVNDRVLAFDNKMEQTKDINFGVPNAQVSYQVNDIVIHSPAKDVYFLRGTTVLDVKHDELAELASLCGGNWTFEIGDAILPPRFSALPRNETVELLQIRIQKRREWYSRRTHPTLSPGTLLKDEDMQLIFGHNLNARLNVTIDEKVVTMMEVNKVKVELPPFVAKNESLWRDSETPTPISGPLFRKDEDIVLQRNETLKRTCIFTRKITENEVRRLFLKSPLTELKITREEAIFVRDAPLPSMDGLYLPSPEGYSNGVFVLDRSNRRLTGTSFYADKTPFTRTYELTEHHISRSNSTDSGTFVNVIVGNQTYALADTALSSKGGFITIANATHTIVEVRAEKAEFEITAIDTAVCFSTVDLDVINADDTSIGASLRLPKVNITLSGSTPSKEDFSVKFNVEQFHLEAAGIVEILAEMEHLDYEQRNTTVCLAKNTGKHQLHTLISNMMVKSVTAQEEEENITPLLYIDDCGNCSGLYRKNATGIYTSLQGNCTYDGSSSCKVVSTNIEYEMFGALSQKLVVPIREFINGVLDNNNKQREDLVNNGTCPEKKFVLAYDGLRDALVYLYIGFTVAAVCFLLWMQLFRCFGFNCKGYFPKNSLSSKAIVPAGLSVAICLALIGSLCAILSSAISTAGLLTGTARIIGDKGDLLESGSFTMKRFALWETIIDMYQGEAYILCATIGFTSGVLPYIICVGLLIVWLTPPQYLSHNKRRKIASVLNWMTKLIIINIFYLTLLTHVFHIRLKLSRMQEGSDVSSKDMPDVLFDTFCKPHFGFYSFLAGTISCSICSIAVRSLAYFDTHKETQEAINLDITAKQSLGVKCLANLGGSNAAHEGTVEKKFTLSAYHQELSRIRRQEDRELRKRKTYDDLDNLGAVQKFYQIVAGIRSFVRRCWLSYLQVEYIILPAVLVLAIANLAFSFAMETFALKYSGIFGYMMSLDSHISLEKSGTQTDYTAYQTEKGTTTRLHTLTQVAFTGINAVKTGFPLDNDSDDSIAPYLVQVFISVVTFSFPLVLLLFGSLLLMIPVHAATWHRWSLLFTFLRTYSLLNVLAVTTILILGSTRKLTKYMIGNNCDVVLPMMDKLFGDKFKPVCMQTDPVFPGGMTFIIVQWVLGVYCNLRLTSIIYTLSSLISRTVRPCNVNSKFELDDTDGLPRIYQFQKVVTASTLDEPPSENGESDNNHGSDSSRESV